MSCEDYMDSSKFFHTFVKDITNFAKKEETERRDKIIEKHGFTVHTISLLKNSMIPIIQRPQKCMLNTEHFYVATDIYSDTVYICFKELMMVDIDTQQTTDEFIKFVQTYCEQNPEVTLHLYKSKNGYHIFFTHKVYNYKDTESLEIMLALGGDFYYTIFSHLRGWSVRLNHKQYDCFTGEGLYTRLGKFGMGEELPLLVFLVNLQYQLSEEFAYSMISKMR